MGRWRVGRPKWISPKSSWPIGNSVTTRSKQPAKKWHWPAATRTNATMQTTTAAKRRIVSKPLSSSKLLDSIRNGRIKYGSIFSAVKWAIIDELMNWLQTMQPESMAVNKHGECLQGKTVRLILTVFFSFGVPPLQHPHFAAFQTRITIIIIIISIF